MLCENSEIFYKTAKVSLLMSSLSKQHTSSALLIALCLLLTVFKVNAHNHKHIHHTENMAPAIGIHGMAAFTDGVSFYASHMPLANSMHAHQVIFSFKINPKHQALLRTLADNNALLSIMPERFDLMALISGQLSEFTGDLYVGHFERGGKVAIKGAKFTVITRLLTAPLHAKNNGQFYLIPTHGKHGLLVHQIALQPSFDQIFHVRFNQSPPLTQSTVSFDLDKPTTADELNQPNHQPLNFSVIQSLYLETQDFN